MAAEPTVTYEAAGPIAVVSLAKPDLNTLDLATIDGVIDALKQADGDDGIRAVVVTSALEKAFCAGLDLGLVLDGGAAVMRELLQRLYIDLFDVQHHLGKPSIAAVNGVARGGGMTLALSCDVVVAADNASSAIPNSTSASCRAFISPTCRGWLAATRRSNCCSGPNPSTPRKRPGSAWSTRWSRPAGCGTRP